MTATPFALVSAADRAKIFAYGLDIDLPSGRDVVTFRRDSDGRTTFAVHQSVETALRRLCAVGDEFRDEDGACARDLGR